MTTRTMVVVVPHWSFVAGGIAPDVAAVVVRANRVLDVTPAANSDGVEVGMGRREAQGRCPSVAVLEHDPDLDARRFEPVVAALETFTPRVELLGQGRCSFPTRGPSRYFGGDEALSASIATAADAELAHVFNQDEAPHQYATCVGVADGLFAASMAAELPHGNSEFYERLRLVKPGNSREFVAPMSVSALRRWSAPLNNGEHLVDLFCRLGLSTLGLVAEVPEADLLARFGADGSTAHRLASGLDERPPDTRPVPPESHVEAELDPPAERVDTASFVAKTLADQLHTRLAAVGLACTRIIVEAVTEKGETLSRVWRHEGALSAVDVADRVRWQLDGWLTSSRRPTSAITHIRLIPDEVIADRGRQLGFWGGQQLETDRASRALARVQGLLGAKAVSVPERRGGRNEGDAVGTVALTLVDLADETRGIDAPSAAAPWPGRLPAPSPTAIHAERRLVQVIDVSGQRVTVSGRGDLSAEPEAVIDGRHRLRVVGWAGPWLIDECWWDTTRHQRRARFQIVTDDGAAHMVSLLNNEWAIDASYE